MSEIEMIRVEREVPPQGEISPAGVSDDGLPMVMYAYPNGESAELIEVCGPNLLRTIASFGPLDIPSYSECRRIHAFVEGRK